MKTNNSKLGRLYAMTYEGSSVISRKSLKEVIPYKHWEKSTHRVKTAYPDSQRINNIIKSKIDEFQLQYGLTLTGDDEQCALLFMRHSIETSNLNIPTKDKYFRILKNFEYVVYKNLKMQSLPFRMLRNIQFVKVLKNEIRKSRKSNGVLKKNKPWWNYMSTFAKYVSIWNQESGTQFPINVLPLTSGIGKDPKQIVEPLSHEELQSLNEYNPNGYKDGFSQTLSKNIFLFQYFTGGIRIQDALTLTNKDIRINGIQVTIRKTRQSELFPFCFEQIDCLKAYYPEEFENSINTVKLGSIELSASTILSINQIEGVGDFSDFILWDIQRVIQILLNKKQSNKELDGYVKVLEEVEDFMKQEICSVFFDNLKKRPQSFLFPKLNWVDFRDVIEKGDYTSYTMNHEYLIHKARASHNSNLKRIAKQIGINKMTGHIPRHTLANHLYSDGFTIEQIQEVLIHSYVHTTKIYLRDRQNSDRINKTVSESHVKFREIRKQIKRKGH